MNTIVNCYVLPTLIGEEVVNQDSTGHGHQYTLQLLMNVKSKIILRNLAAFIFKALKARDCSLKNINTLLLFVQYWIFI